MLSVVLSAVSLIPSEVSSESLLSGAHALSPVLPKSCRACHSGMRMSITGEEQVCLNCHGNDTGRRRMEARGALGRTMATELKDIGAVLQKPYHHPVVDVANIHRQSEVLPEEQLDAARHSECIDCHDPHRVAKDAPFAGIPGRKVLNATVSVVAEYELCYRCHAESANLPGNSTNKHAEFKTTNRSFHPVEGEGANSYVISLKAPYAARADRADAISVISCSDCHGNDDASGPRGPHGSNFQGLLVEHYEMRDGLSESYYAYALCYRCHDRNSILGDESFPKHSLHITGGSTGQGAPCIACHDAHGSVRNPSLLSFDENIVQPTVSGKLEYKSTTGTDRSGSCTLVCHGVEHNERSY